ncbi:MAG: hypothetical protein QOD75_1871 [Blastocatellia bacterium]|nr:hypothetical protein [Blastocatellia bacterium]
MVSYPGILVANTANFRKEVGFDHVRLDDVGRTAGDNPAQLPNCPWIKAEAFGNNIDFNAQSSCGRYESIGMKF